MTVEATSNQAFAKAMPTPPPPPMANVNNINGIPPTNAIGAMP